MNNLDKLIQDYYQAQTLSENRSSAILQQTAVTPGKMSRRRWLQAAAMAAVSVGGFTTLHLHLNERSLTERVLAEIAMNHQKHLASEINSDDYVLLTQELDKLDFQLRAPLTLAANMKLLGGRYCSINGELAAQLKLRDPNSRDVHTLFITQLTPALKRIDEREARADGIALRLWREHDMFFALARDD